MKIEVDAEALRQVLQALIGPPHHIRELQAIRGLPGDTSPIDKLVNEYNVFAAKSSASGGGDSTEGAPGGEGSDSTAGVNGSNQSPEGFMEAFYEMAAMLGIEGAQAKSPEQVYREQVKPALAALKERAENAEAAYLNMREWAQANGLDTTARTAGVPPSDGGQQG